MDRRNKKLGERHEKRKEGETRKLIVVVKWKEEEKKKERQEKKVDVLVEEADEIEQEHE